MKLIKPCISALRNRNALGNLADTITGVKDSTKLRRERQKFKVLQGNNLAIRMFAGYVFTDCLDTF